MTLLVREVVVQMYKPGTNLIEIWYKLPELQGCLQKVRELMLLFTNHYIHIKTHGKIFHVCLRSVLLYGSDSWVLRKENKVQLARIGLGMKGQESYISVFVAYATIRFFSLCNKYQLRSTVQT